MSKTNEAFEIVWTITNEKVAGYTKVGDRTFGCTCYKGIESTRSLKAQVKASIERQVDKYLKSLKSTEK